jgi:hypothetical protein
MDKKTQLYADLQDASRAQISDNINTHKLQTARFRSGTGRRQALRAALPQTPMPKTPLDFLAIGDSWFEYPLNGNVLSLSNTATPSNNFSIVDTRGTLKHDTSEPLGWANELHPYATGFNALASRFLTALQAMPQFSNRI